MDRFVVRQNANEVLKRLNIAVGQDFYTLSPEQVLALLVEADREKYRLPRGATGSRARYFHERLQRHAVMKT